MHYMQPTSPRGPTWHLEVGQRALRLRKARLGRLLALQQRGLGSFRAVVHVDGCLGADGLQSASNKGLPLLTEVYTLPTTTLRW